MKALTALAALLAALTLNLNPAHAEAPELTDVATPEQIYSEMIASGRYADLLGLDESELDAADLGADGTSAAKPGSRETARVYILVSKARQHLWVYIDGQSPRGWNWKVSTGTEQKRCPPPPHGCRIARTPTGLRHPGIMNWEHYSSLYGGAAMHRSIQFVGGIFLHATYGENIRKLGTRDSGGCIRQHPENAEKLWLLVQDTVKRHGKTSVVIEIVEE